jgi:autotransporter adhesin
MRISQHITDHARWTRKLLMGAGALALAAVLVPGGFVPKAEAMECANAGVQTTNPNDDGAAINTACGDNAQATDNYSTAVGSFAHATGAQSTAVGEAAQATANFSTALGQNAQATGSGISTAVGNFAQATAAASTALGANAKASGLGSVALGASSIADEINTVSVGRAGVFTRRITNVAMGARGNDAVTVKQLKKSLKKSFKKGKAKVVTGKIQTTAQTSDQDQASTTVAKTSTSKTKTKSGGSSGNQTASAGGGPFYGGSSGYSAPGITSSAARSRQSGPLEVVTSDKNGNLATDGGQIFKRLDEGQSGVALAIAMANPDLTGNERFGMAANWGRFEDANALSVTAMGVLAHNLVTEGDRVALAGGFGAGFDEGRGDTVYGGRVGMQWTWGARR